ncbi:PEP-CTERM sorting domain-containing protein [Janthinobacterium sp. ROICE36]|uniref:FxDxF family PEP-CTERM protein n=1 Tax=Janthinobacterium sp. ROICE36 TaxID=2048670 RepID=UPI000C7F33AD|nr:PEP-CTERM sorting domain-containing protein [Janthinobacterium sp. ROICE36]
MHSATALFPIPVKESILQTTFSRLKIMSAAVLLLAASAAQADITVFTSQSAYLAAVGNTGVDTFDDLPIDNLGGPLNRSAGSYAYTASSVGVSPILYGAGTGSDNWLSTNDRNDNVLFSNFSSAVRGVGGFFFGSNFVGEYADSQSVTLTARNALGEMLTYELTLPTQASFIGFLSSGAFSDLSVSTAGQVGIWPTINNLTVSAVPEPATYGMLLGGLGLLGFMARRRRTSQG